MLAFSGKQAYEEYYVAFNFGKVVASGVTIVSATVLVYDALGVDVTAALTDETKQSIEGNKIYIWVRGGNNQTYKITCRIICSNDERYEDDATLTVLEI